MTEFELESLVRIPNELINDIPASVTLGNAGIFTAAGMKALEFLRAQNPIRDATYPVYEENGRAVWPMPAPFEMPELELERLELIVNGGAVSFPFAQGLRNTLSAFNFSLVNQRKEEIESIFRELPYLLAATWHYGNCMDRFRQIADGATVTRPVELTWREPGVNLDQFQLPDSVEDLELETFFLERLLPMADHIFDKLSLVAKPEKAGKDRNDILRVLNGHPKLGPGMLALLKARRARPRVAAETIYGMWEDLTGGEAGEAGEAG